MELRQVGEAGPVQGVEGDEDDGEDQPGSHLDVTHPQPTHSGGGAPVAQLPLHDLHSPPEVLPPLQVQFDPLACVADSGVLKQGPKHHPEAKCQVDLWYDHTVTRSLVSCEMALIMLK